METNKIIDTLYNIAVELDRECEFIQTKINDYEMTNQQYVADYWCRELSGAYRLRLSVLEEIIPFVRENIKTGGEEG